MPVVFKIVDYDGDVAQFSMDSEAALADGTNYAVLNTETGALRAAIEAITIGTLFSADLVAKETDLTPTPPANAFAQNNIQWKVNYTVNGTTDKRSVKIGTADLAQPVIIQNGTPLLDPSSAVYTTFKTAFEDLVRDGGQNVTLQSIEYVE